MAAQTVIYYTKNTSGQWMLSKSQNQDDTYGIAGKSIRTPYTMGVINPVNGKLLTSVNLLDRLEQPIWGPNNDQYFIDLIPDFPAKVPATLPDTQWQSFPFDPQNPETYPKTECPPDSQSYPEYGGPRGWECQPLNHPNQHYQNMHWYGVAESLPAWTILKIVSYRRQKDAWDNPVIPNPDYPIVEAERAAAGVEYNNLVRSELIPVATYQFQGLPLDANGVEYQWSINGVKSPPIPGHKLAVTMTSPTTSTWKMIQVQMRNPEIIKVNTSGGVWTRELYEETYATKTNESRWDLTKEAKMLFLTQ